MEHWLLRAAAMRPNLSAVGELTYAELTLRARSAAGALLAQGVAIGDRVGIALPAGPDFIAAMHGIWMVGAAAVPVDLRLSAAERSARAGGARLIVAGALDGPEIEDPQPLREDAVATVMHTSGSTAAPRAVELTFGNWLANAFGSAVALGLDRTERWLCALPLPHVGGLSIPIRSALYATSVVLHERFDTEAVLAALMDEGLGVTLISLVPTMLARLLDAGLRDPPTLRWALLGGAPLPPALLTRAREAGVPVAPTYGMTETCSQIATHGWPLAGIEVEIASDGEVLVAGPVVSPGAVAEDGWLHTGDRGSFDERGRLQIVGRKAETIISGGENVVPVEVEDVLLEHPEVADAAVFGRADPEWGEAIVAKVVRREGAVLSATELQDFCARRLARYKVPKAVEFEAVLPRTQSGKLLRRELR